MPVELGGGLRSIASIRRAFAAGASRVVLGTAAFTDPDLLDEALSAFTSRILVAWTCVAGWCRCPAGRARLRCGARTRSGACSERGVTRFVYTNVDRDGMLDGMDLEEVRRSPRPCAGGFSTQAGSARSTTCVRCGDAASEPRRSDLRQGALRGALRRARGAGGPAPDAPPPRDPVPRRGQGPSGEGRGVREPARRRRPGGAGGALPGGGRRRDRVPRHHGLAREARDGGPVGAALRRRRVHPVHDRRRRAQRRGRPGGA